MGTGQSKQRVLRFLNRKDIRSLHHRVEKDPDSFGRVSLHFRWKQPAAPLQPRLRTAASPLGSRLLPYDGLTGGGRAGEDWLGHRIARTRSARPAAP
jgi:hypothetical protein